jgi:hypothetical protein
MTCQVISVSDILCHVMSGWVSLVYFISFRSCYVRLDQIMSGYIMLRQVICGQDRLVQVITG